MTDLFKHQLLWCNVWAVLWRGVDKLNVKLYKVWSVDFDMFMKFSWFHCGNISPSAKGSKITIKEIHFHGGHDRKQFQWLFHEHKAGFCLDIAVNFNLFSDVWIFVKTIIIDAMMGPCKFLRKTCTVPAKLEQRTWMDFSMLMKATIPNHSEAFIVSPMLLLRIPPWSPLLLTVAPHPGGVVHLLFRGPPKSKAVDITITTMVSIVISTAFDGFIHWCCYFQILQEFHLRRMFIYVMIHMK